MFKYVLVPADTSRRIEEISAPKGSLENEELRKRAEQEFGRDEGKMDNVKHQQETVAQLVSQGMDQSKIEEFVQTHASNLGSNVEIITIQVACAKNNFIGVSIYCDANSKFKAGVLPNERVTSLLRLCGHKDLVAMGDCFIGRCLDDESCEWERRDFPLDDFRPDADWVLDTAAANKGRNMQAYSTSGSLKAMTTAKTEGGGGLGQGLGLGGGGGRSSSAPPPPGGVVGEGFTWSQTAEEVEVRVRVPQISTAKNIRVVIGATALRITLPSTTSSSDEPDLDKRLVTGATLFEKVSAGESTWTIENERGGAGAGVRVLCISLAKANNQTWRALFVE